MDLICSRNDPLRAPRRAPRVQKWVGDANPVNLGQLDHYVVFGTESGAVQDFQRGLTCLIGGKSIPLGFQSLRGLCSRCIQKFLVTSVYLKLCIRVTQGMFQFRVEGIASKIYHTAC